MLVLSRTKNEAIVIDGNIVVTILEVRGDRVRLGISAPDQISIDRHEIHQAKERTKAHQEPQPVPACVPNTGC